jgi:hypothetical protein
MSLGVGVEADPRTLRGQGVQVVGSTIAALATVPTCTAIVVVPATTMAVTTVAPSVATTTAAPTLVSTGVASTSTTARRAGRRRGGRRKGHLRDDLRFIGDHGFLQGKHGSCLAEGGEQSCIGDVVGGVRELGALPV